LYCQKKDLLLLQEVAQMASFWPAVQYSF
jgi:hypothetical protein